MKLCTCCKENKDETMFYKNQNRKRSVCKSCWSAVVVKNQLRIKLKMIAYKGDSCEKCGYNKHYSALEFHHKDKSKKEFALSKATSFEKAKPELDKCILLCANCHREEHAK